MEYGLNTVGRGTTDVGTFSPFRQDQSVVGNGSSNGVTSMGTDGLGTSQESVTAILGKVLEELAMLLQEMAQGQNGQSGLGSSNGLGGNSANSGNGSLQQLLAALLDGAGNDGSGNGVGSVGGAGNGGACYKPGAVGGAGAPANVHGNHGNNSQYDKWIDESAQRNGIDPKLLKSVISNESSFDQNCVSPTGAIGLCQLEPGTAREMGVDPHNARENIEGGARYLSKMMHQFNGNTQLAVAAYNAGPGAVQHAGGIPHFAETQTYVGRVMDSYRHYSNAA